MTKAKRLVFRGHKKAQGKARRGRRGIYYVKAQTAPVKRLASRLGKYAQQHTWLDTALQFQITNDKGQPSPGLACLIAGGYMPGLNVCKRLHIKGECPACHQHITRDQRHLPEWVTIGADFLAAHERK